MCKITSFADVCILLVLGKNLFSYSSVVLFLIAVNHPQKRKEASNPIRYRICIFDGVCDSYEQNEKHTQLFQLYREKYTQLSQFQIINKTVSVFL